MRVLGMVMTLALLMWPVAPAHAAGRAPCVAALKQVLLIKRRPGMTVHAFREYYERHHAPLALALLGRYLVDYRRNFVIPRGDTGSGRDVGYDVVTELWFADQATFDAFTAFTCRPEVVAKIAADEERFMDRPMTRQFTVDECRSVR